MLKQNFSTLESNPDELVEYNKQLAELSKQVSDEYTKLNKVRFAYKKETERIQALIQKQKNYRDALEKRLEYRASRLGFYDDELRKSITETEEYKEYLRARMRQLDEETMFYIANKLGYKITKENYYNKK